MPELLHQEIAQNLVDWAANNAVESDHIIQSLIQDLAAEANLKQSIQLAIRHEDILQDQYL